jgi:hypothetical protein
MSRILVISASFVLFGAFMLAAVMSTEASPGAGVQIQLIGR